MKSRVVSIVCCVLAVGVQTGCAARTYKRIALTAPVTGERVTTCYVLGSGGSQILSAGVKQVDERWLHTGRMRGSPPLPPSSRTLRIEAITDDESVVFSDTGTALPANPGVRKKSRFAIFGFEIPDPDGFDHLHLALISLGERDLHLRARGAGR